MKNQIISRNAGKGVQNFTYHATAHFWREEMVGMGGSPMPTKQYNGKQENKF